VASGGEYLKFFRFRSPLVLEGEGAKGDIWLEWALQFIDFSKEALLKEYFWIANHSQGGFTYRDICGMSFKEYEIVLNEAKKIDAKMKKKAEDNG
jgi:hypothetical protein